MTDDSKKNNETEQPRRKRPRIRIPVAQPQYERNNREPRGYVSPENRVYFDCVLAELYDICNAPVDLKTEINYISELYEQTQSRQKEVFANADTVRAKSMLRAWHLLDTQDHLLPREELLRRVASTLKYHKQNDIVFLLADLQKDKSLNAEFKSYIRSTYHIYDLQKEVIDNPNRGDGQNIKENLALHYTEYKNGDTTVPLVKAYETQIMQQIRGIGMCYIDAKENKEENAEIRKNFNNVAKPEFLKMMGHILAIGEALHEHNPFGLQISYDKIRNLAKNPNMSDEAIKKLAQQTYAVTVDGLWTYKNSVNYDRHARRDDYIKYNVHKWIENLKRGNNNIYFLTFLDADESKEYLSASEQKQAEIAAKHISVHHKIPIKYHNFTNDMFAVNDISNLMMVIGGALHNNEHKNEIRNTLKLSAKRDDRILLGPFQKYNGDRYLGVQYTQNVSMDISEPEMIKDKRPKFIDRAKNTGKSIYRFLAVKFNKNRA